jgi:hypothetical protein
MVDGLPATCGLFFAYRDVAITRFFIDTPYSLFRLRVETARLNRAL